jgi:hypothetical protein
MEMLKTCQNPQSKKSPNSAFGLGEAIAALHCQS